MLQFNTEVAKFQLAHKKTDTFTVTFTMQTPDGKPFSVEELDPVLEVYFKGEIIVLMEGEDFEKTEYGELILTKGRTFFVGLSSLKKYTYRFYDRGLQKTLTEGPFKITA